MTLLAIMGWTVAGFIAGLCAGFLLAPKLDLDDNVFLNDEEIFKNDNTGNDDSFLADLGTPDAKRPKARAAVSKKATTPKPPVSKVSRPTNSNKKPVAVAVKKQEVKAPIKKTAARTTSTKAKVKVKK